MSIYMKNSNLAFYVNFGGIPRDINLEIEEGMVLKFLSRNTKFFTTSVLNWKLLQHKKFEDFTGNI